MWQNLANALIGSVLVIVAILATSLGSMAALLGWTFGILDAVVVACAVWALFDEMAERRDDRAIQSDI